MDKSMAGELPQKKKNIAFFDYLVHSPFLFEEEYALLGEISRRLIASNILLTKKRIASELINALETSKDSASADIIRNTLEVVLSYGVDQT